MDIALNKICDTINLSTVQPLASNFVGTKKYTVGTENAP